MREPNMKKSSLLVGMLSVFVLLAIFAWTVSVNAEGETLVMQVWSWSPEVNEKLDQTIEDFNDSFGTNVQVIRCSFSEHWARLEDTCAAGSPPDLFWVTRGLLADLTWCVMPLEDLIPDLIARTSPKLLDIFTLDNTLYGLPLDLSGNFVGAGYAISYTPAAKGRLEVTVKLIRFLREHFPNGDLLTFDEAKDKVINEVIRPDEVERPLVAVGWREPLKQGDIISAVYPDGPEFPMEEESWFFWLDDAPLQGFAHETRYVFVNRRTGDLRVHEVDWWPLLNGEDMWDTPEEYWNEDNLIWSNVSPPSQSLGQSGGNPSFAAGGGAAQPGQMGNPVKTRHLIIQGPDKPGCTNMATDAQNWYKMAKEKLGLNDADIIYLSPNKVGANADNPSTLAKVTDALKGLSNTLKASDWLTIFITTHGAPNGDRVIQGSILTPTELGKWIKKFKAGVHITVVIQGCFGGKLIPELKKNPKVIDLVITATDDKSVCYNDRDNDTPLVGWASRIWGYFERVTHTTVKLDPNPKDTGSEFSSGLIESLAKNAGEFRAGRLTHRQLYDQAFEYAKNVDSTYQNGDLLVALFEGDQSKKPDPQFWRSPEVLHQMASVTAKPSMQRVRDLVQQGEILRGNEVKDGMFTIPLQVDDGGTVRIVGLELRARPWGYHVWDTTPRNNIWAMGVAYNNAPTTLLNKADTTVDIEIKKARTLLLYCENDGGLWGPQSGGEFDLTITFSDGHVIKTDITLPVSQN